ncbi:hypothetical protein Tco_1315013 [Tanacetum coccineum]
MSTQRNVEYSRALLKKVGLIDGIGKNDLETDKGVFGNVENNHNKGGNSYANKDVSVDPLTESEFDVTSNKRDKNCMDSNENDESAKYLENVVKPTENKKMNETYLSKVKDEIPKKLCYKPIMVNDNGTEVIVFDEMLEKKGCERWTLTACSYFVGYRIPPNELRYNIRRIIDGISALVISLVNPLIMDTMTASMCYSGLGRLDFALVLVEMDTEKEFKKEIEVQYRDGENKIKGIKKDLTILIRSYDYDLVKPKTILGKMPILTTLMTTMDAKRGQRPKSKLKWRRKEWRNMKEVVEWQAMKLQ